MSPLANFSGTSNLLASIAMGNSFDFAPRMTVRIGCRLVYEATEPTPIWLVVRPMLSGNQFIMAENLSFPCQGGYQEFWDTQGNLTQRAVLPVGQTTIVHDALVDVSSLADDSNRRSVTIPIEQVSPEVYRYVLPSRYCDSDKIQSFASAQFGGIINGVDRVVAICNWVHSNIRYVTGSGSANISASEIMARGYGVCRDFAHVAIALCRAVNIPARYVTGHLPDIGIWNPGTPMDFHAYFEAYLDHQWCTFDARFNVPRIGRVKIAHGLDAVDGAFSSLFGGANLISFEVWAYQIDPREVALGDPVDLSKRLDGTPQLRFE